MVEIPRPFGGAQETLQAKRKFVMAAQAGIQVAFVAIEDRRLDSRFRGKDGRRSRLPVAVIESLDFESAVV
jgi:hypothetical protein